MINLQEFLIMINWWQSPGWWNGIHERLKISCSSELAGSSPAPGTTLSVVIGTLSVPPLWLCITPYILISQKDGKLYIGSTPDLRKRIKKHQQGFVKATKSRLPIKLIYYECYLEKSNAKKRELYLKGGKGHGELKIQLENTFKKIITHLSN